MFLLLGARGYIGQAFARELRGRGEAFIPLSRATLDYTRFELLFEYVRKIRPDFLINAGGIWGRPNVDACEEARPETFQANTLLPQTVSRVCIMTNTPWGHVSSACIYSGAKVFQEGETRKSEIVNRKSNGGLRVVRDLERPELRRLFAAHPECFIGFNETDEPNFSFRSPPCNYMAGTKVLAEERLRGCAGTYIWRVGRPFTERDEPQNLLSRLMFYPKVFDHFGAVSHLQDFVRACLELVERRAPYGVYNLTNPGAVTTRQIVEMVQARLKPVRQFEFWRDDQEFYADGTRAPRSSCIIDSSKARRAGAELRPAQDALEDALEHWASATQRSAAFTPLRLTYADATPEKESD